MVGTQPQMSLGPIVWVMFFALMLAMAVMIVALYALSRDRKKPSKQGIAYLHRSLYAGAPKPVITRRPSKTSRSKVTVFPGNVSRVRLMTIQSQADNMQADKEVM
jgi:hypothetical protein